MIPRQTEADIDRWWARIPHHLRGLVRLYLLGQQQKTEENARQREVEQRKAQKEAADAVKAFQRRRT